MALAVDFRKFTPRDSRADLIRKLEQAPEEHAEALLASYDLLQRLHEKGLIDLANGLLCASDTVVDNTVELISSKQAVTALRTLLMLSNLLASVDADQLHNLLSGSEAKPPSMWQLGKQAMTANARRGMATAMGLLNLFGAALRKESGH